MNRNNIYSRSEDEEFMRTVKCYSQHFQPSDGNFAVFRAYMWLVWLSRYRYKDKAYLSVISHEKTSQVHLFELIFGIFFLFQHCSVSVIRKEESRYATFSTSKCICSAFDKNKEGRCRRNIKLRGAQWFKENFWWIRNIC